MLDARVAATLDLLFVPGPRLIIYVSVFIVMGLAFALREILLDGAAFIWELITNGKAAKAPVGPPQDSLAAAFEQIRQRDASFTTVSYTHLTLPTICSV